MWRVSYYPVTKLWQISCFVQCLWSRIWPLFPDTKLNLGDRVLGEVKKNSFIALPGKGVHSWLMPSKLCVPTWRGSEEFSSNGSKRAWSARGHSSDGLVVRWVEASITSLLVPTGLGSTCLWAPYRTFSTWWEFQYLQNSSKVSLCVSLEGEPGPWPKAELLFLLTFPLLSRHLLPSLINIPLNLTSPPFPN